MSNRQTKENGLKSRQQENEQKHPTEPNVSLIVLYLKICCYQMKPYPMLRNVCMTFLRKSAAVRCQDGTANLNVRLRW